VPDIFRAEAPNFEILAEVSEVGKILPAESEPKGKRRNRKFPALEKLSKFRYFLFA
jgi:hypothetical protein